MTIRVFADMAFFLGVLLAAAPDASGFIASSLTPSASTGTINLIPGQRQDRISRSSQEEWFARTRSPFFPSLMP